MKRRKTPCIDICEFTGPKGWCIGCGRTRPECDKWYSMKPYDRNILLQQLKKRMTKIKSVKQS